MDSLCHLLWLKSRYSVSFSVCMLTCSSNIYSHHSNNYKGTKDNLFFRTLTKDSYHKDRKLLHRRCIQKFGLVYPCITQFNVIDLQGAS